MAFVEVSKQGHVGIVTMNRPETLNALSSAVFADLLKAFDVVENDEEIYVVVVTGAGRSFVAGADISEMATMNVVEGKNFGDLGNQAMLRLERMEKPTIAAINGFALGGGCELSMACDIRIASEKAKFGQPEVGLGITPGFVVNRILFPMINEAIIVLENGIASKEDIDTAMMYGANHKMGPLALADLVGLDICLAIMETIYTETGDSKYRPALTMKKMVRAGLLGQKTGEGFYKY